MPDLAALNRMEAQAFVALLGGVFEHAPWVAEAAWPHRPFASVGALHDAMMRAVRHAPAERRRVFLNNHPELAGPEARARSLTADSANEQGSAGLDRIPAAEAAAFDRLNADYRARFGFPFIIAVRGRSRAEILAAFEARLIRDPAVEEATALEEIAQITRMRLDGLVAD
ncbi:2-oxo-4-hydroxy-4-carboxy-5-ureidoimidazoline decarboxylase [Methylobacterium pseudosasicola]|uniref:2-oxo-4-hydroxy-4-carboxy-5-ureidoimidazoline decarboxylase n=1 Tax=Methylobacterium pseudosasicola TaxID=582667 RepID=A0A1I4HGV0_9HYPH|nr:2-oxo-4-hydroxy-4-carboxy-5-ureidoimidazoline decarboxylase [Methylobacterium pseudosasicola]SFL41499.1 2-oxo-4-hydroxy-4-carboxy-5-ureidoimidazoline decarboxylase [Methylobacterium pseudosasicola]